MLNFFNATKFAAQKSRRKSRGANVAAQNSQPQKSSRIIRTAKLQPEKHEPEKGKPLDRRRKNGKPQMPKRKPRHALFWLFFC